MNNEEFDEWSGHHAALHPAWAKAYAKINDDQGRAAKAAMIRRLLATPLWAAKEASDRLLDRPTRLSTDKHAVEIAKLAKEIVQRSKAAAGRASAGTETYACLLCRDSGFALVYAGQCTWPGRYTDSEGNQLSIRQNYERRHCTKDNPELGYRMVLTIPCYCDSSRSPQPGAEKHYRRLVSAHKRWLDLSETERIAVLFGLPLEAGPGLPFGGDDY